MPIVARRCSPLAPKFALNLPPRALGSLATRPADGEQLFQSKATPRLPSAGFGPSPILPNLYLGCYGDAQSRETLQRLGIRRILNLAAEECEDTVAQELNLQLLSIALRDHSDAPISEFFDQCFAFIEDGIRRQEPVLVHCRMGVSRSATIVIAYLMSHGGDSAGRNWSYEASFDYVKDRRPLVSPNLGFVLTLHHLEQKCTAAARSMSMSTAAKCVACSC